MSIVNPRDLYRERYTIESVNRLIDDSSFKQVSRIDGLLTAIVNSISFNFFLPSLDMEWESTSLRLYKPIYIRQYQVRERECQVNLNQKCYYDYYNADTRSNWLPCSSYLTLFSKETSSYSDKYGNEYVFNFHETNDFEGKIKGHFGEYTNDAYLTSYDASTMT